MVDSHHNTRLMCPATKLQMSSIGGGSEDNPNNNGDDDDNPINEWIQRRDTENVRRYREQFSEGRLPISYGAMNDDDNNESTGKFGPLSQDTSASSHNDNENDDAIIDATSSSSTAGGGLSRSKEPNPYLNVVSRLAPSDLISKFTSSASPRVQDAVRTTVLGLIGGLPQMAFETKTIATGERL